MSLPGGRDRLAGRDRLRHDAVELADRYRHLLTPAGSRRHDLAAAVIAAAQAQARARTPNRHRDQLALDLNGPGVRGVR